MPIVLHVEGLDRALERAYGLAIGDQELPATWSSRAEQLASSPSVAFIAAVGAVLLAKATDDRIDALVIQAREGGPGAFNLRAAATALARRKRAFGYDIGSSSDRDPINHGTLVGSTRWDVALDRIRGDHKPFFQLILTWLADVNRMSAAEATLALAAYLRVRRAVPQRASLARVTPELASVPALHALVDVLDGFVGADAERGARGMALVAAAYRAAGLEALLPSRNDPRRIDVAIKRNRTIVIACEVKQVATTEPTADSLATEASKAGARRALLAVLPPGMLVDFDRPAVVRRAEREHGVVLRVVAGVRELLHEALASASVDVEAFCADLPRTFAEALAEARVADETLETWAAIASRWR